ncbi:MAG: hypothetical protein C0608_07270 [Deltaproteobacteria bacterium]|nr:MAG: hypothetical protein C0608_07270 [Deltaproteobacteria bacterium]
MALNLYKAKITKPLIKNPIYQRTVQGFAILSLIYLLTIAWGREAIPGIPDRWPLIYTNATTLIFWVIWFMGLVLTVPLLGRLWCSICPLGYITERFAKMGRAAPWPRSWGGWLGMIIIFLAGMGGALSWNVHKSPHATAILVGIAALFAALSGFLWRGAPFCKLFCPVGVVLSLYSRFSPVKVAAINPELCKTCNNGACVRRETSWRRWSISGRVFHRKLSTGGCPVGLYPPKMDATRCQLCMECIRRCPSENLGLFYGARPLGGKLSTAALILLVLLTGLVTLALARTWPAFSINITPSVNPSQRLTYLWLGLVLPAVIIFAPAFIGALTKTLSGSEVTSPNDSKAAVGEGFWSMARTSAIPFIGPLFGGHMALALVKLNAKALYLTYLPYDPTGAETYLAIHVADTLPLPDMILHLYILRWVALSLLGCGVIAGVFEMRSSWRSLPGNISRFFGLSSYFSISILFAALLQHWLFPGR